MASIVVKVVAPKVNPNAKWLVYVPDGFNDLLHANEVPPKVRDYVVANNGVQYFEADVMTKPITWGDVAPVPTDWPTPPASKFARRPGGVVTVHSPDEATAPAPAAAAQVSNGKVTVGVKL